MLEWRPGTMAGQRKCGIQYAFVYSWLNHQLSRVWSLHLGSSPSRWMTWNGVSASLPASPLVWKNFPPCLLLRKHSPHATPTFRIHKAMLSMILGQMNQSDQRTDLSKDSSRSRMHWTKNTSTTSLPADCHLAVTGGHLDTMWCEFHGLLWRLLGLHAQVDMGYTRCSPVPWHATRCFDWKRSL